MAAHFATYTQCQIAFGCTGNSPCAAPCADLIVCVAEKYLTLRISCESHGRKNPLPYPISERSPVSDMRQTKK